MKYLFSEVDPIKSTYRTAAIKCSCFEYRIVYLRDEEIPAGAY
jgi:hypothetical protein